MAGFSRMSLLLLLLAGAAGCDTQDPFATPTQPYTPLSATETFSGTMNRNGAATFAFGTTGTGYITATVSVLGADSGNPDSAVTLGVALGTWNGATCQIVIANDRAAQGHVVTGQTSTAGSFCVRAYDNGNLVGTAAYELQVTHP